MTEREIGKVTHYWPRAGAAAIELQSGTLRVGDKIRIVGHGHDFVQTVTSLQLDHRPVGKATRGANPGVKVDAPVHDNDKVYKVDSSFWDILPFL